MEHLADTVPDGIRGDDRPKRTVWMREGLEDDVVVLRFAPIVCTGCLMGDGTGEDMVWLGTGFRGFRGHVDTSVVEAAANEGRFRTMMDRVMMESVRSQELQSGTFRSGQCGAREEVMYS